mmetsp:Transcript_86111/g.229805  ORF Transcript_86111/g.229805 Transcript_86111/m.229805 type:complete len:101 (-) Transcript_86111:126-428(-)
MDVKEFLRWHRTNLTVPPNKFYQRKKASKVVENESQRGRGGGISEQQNEKSDGDRHPRPNLCFFQGKSTVPTNAAAIKATQVWAGEWTRLLWENGAGTTS